MNRSKRDLRATHPGEILLEEFLKPLGLTMNRLSLDLHVPANRIAQIVDGQRSISVDTALRLARYFGTTPDLWLNLQKDYDLRVARDKLEARIEREVRPHQTKAA